MLKSTIVQAATAPKDETEVRKINYRQTNARWIAMGLGCLVLFGQQYCFDNPSVRFGLSRLSKKPLWRIWHTLARKSRS